MCRDIKQTHQDMAMGRTRVSVGGRSPGLGKKDEWSGFHLPMGVLCSEED